MTLYQTTNTYWFILFYERYLDYYFNLNQLNSNDLQPMEIKTPRTCDHLTNHQLNQVDTLKNSAIKDQNQILHSYFQLLYRVIFNDCKLLSYYRKYLQCNIYKQQFTQDLISIDASIILPTGSLTVVSTLFCSPSSHFT